MVIAKSVGIIPVVAKYIVPVDAAERRLSVEG